MKSIYITSPTVTSHRTVKIFSLRGKGGGTSVDSGIHGKAYS